MYSVKVFNPETCEWTTRVHSIPTAEKATEYANSFEKFNSSQIVEVFKED